MALPANFLDELRARTPIAGVIGRSVKLTRSGRDIKGCCPFHGEKTPSFYVYDDHYHCFGCGEHGDVITFVMKTTGAGFMEAVESLSAEAGLEVPKASPQAAQAEQRRADISEVLAAAGKVYQRFLHEPQGKLALDYLRARGLSDETIRRFGLGWSGEGRGVLAAALRGQGIKPEQLIEAGLMKQGEHGPVDMFFSRVMFPITDRRGNVISFGGRIMGDGQPKYVNGPETAVFSKRRALYGLNLAREAVRKGAQLIVVEGYMDVIALAQGGFGGAVAPLGTALTEEHLAEIWRISPEPVICFDGDAAGRRAALKTADMALGALGADKSLRFLNLPEKDDPDSLIRREGAAAFKVRLESAKPISAALYDMLAEGGGRTTPEARAAFRQRLIEVAGRIPDKNLAGEYRAMLLERFFAERRAGKPGGAKKPAAFVRDVTPPDAAGAQEKRARLMLAVLLAYPALIPDVEEAFARVRLPPACKRLREALGRYAAQAKSLDTESLFTHLSHLGLAGEARLIAADAAGDFRLAPDASLSQVAEIWWSWYILMDFSIEMLRAQRDEQERFWKANQDDAGAWSRLIKYNELLRQAMAGEYGAADP
ncbi:DNA primase [Acidocella sp.]|uniref:DNA primase n=1 Tax=Acidocella sp. TaxID=50710 RepID=UPI0026218E0D|nr:DNA primase [Acidocella sp.]MDD2795500.1 DNA primase [Acidocella sp.]